jgi:hypothetical protein
MDAATAGLIGAGIGGVVSMTTALLSPRINARVAREQFDRTAEEKKLDGLADVLDSAGLALEGLHWALRDAVVRLRKGGAPEGEAWDKAIRRLGRKQREASRQGMRLALRLGVATRDDAPPVVSEYDQLQKRYRDLVHRLRDEVARGKEIDVAAIDAELNQLGEDQHVFIDAAAATLRPASVAGTTE